MAISKEDIKKVAQLARLELNEAEVEKYQGQLASILDYIDMLKEAKVSDLAVLGLESENYNQTRDDEILPCDDKTIKIALDQAPEREADQIKVDRVI